MFEGQTKMREQNQYSSGHKLQLGALCPIPKFCLKLVDLSENRNLLFPFSSVLSLYAIQKNASRTQKNLLLFSDC